MGRVSPTITATETGVHKIETPYRIRKLTPNECWRLMDFSDEDFRKAEEVNSNTQLYKQAGNSICVAVLEALFRQMNIQNIPTWNEVNQWNNTEK
jgi:DNA (cytosine-5)-methyltransferase 1